MALGYQKIPVRIFRWLGVLALMTGCEWRGQPAPSLLVVAVDSLPVESVNCSDQDRPKEESGFAVLCQESVRFTHAYTTSPMSVPALTSLLTGLYPLDHKVRTNGSDFLSARFKTIAEVAFSKGLRTAFWSGGVPVWRKSGLNQGFETFDDQVGLGLRDFYRPAEVQFQALVDWLQMDVGGQPFAAVVYVNDLEFPEVTTTTHSGEIREKSYAGQLHELDESLGLLFDRLKKMKRWNSTYIVLAGLNGVSLRERTKDFSPLNLFSDNTQVALLLKPVSKTRDTGIHWKVDVKVSLADMGKTLHRLLGADPEKGPSENQFPLVSLDAMAQTPNPDWDTERPLLIESAWPKWRLNQPVRYGIHWDHLFALLDQDLKVFNTLIDRTQTLPLTRDEPTWTEVNRKTLDLLEKTSLDRWTQVANQKWEKIRLGREVGAEKENLINVERTVEKYRELLKVDRQVQDWIARLCARSGKWGLLKAQADSWGREDLAVLAMKNLNQKFNYAPKGCLELLASAFDPDQTNSFIRTCPDRMALRLLAWIRTDKDRPDFDRRRDVFLRSYSQDYGERELALQNYRRGLIWDSRLDTIDYLSMADIILGMPEFKTYADSVRRRLQD